MKVIILISVILLSDVINGQSDDVLNLCLDGGFRKTTPGPEAELFNKCSPWEERSCCTNETSYKSHQDGWENNYNFTYDHCSEIKAMSPECKEMFQENNCFYECSPNLGPWLVSTNGYEQYKSLPLCESKCVQWWEACKDDYTCKENWVVGWNYTSGINECPNDTECRTFQAVFNNATNFCQTLFPEEYVVIPDQSAPCMTLWFEGENPNDEVARYYAKELGLCCGSVNHQVSVLFVAVMMMTSYLWNC